MAVTAGPPERMAEMASTHGSVAERILLYIFLSPLLEFGKTVFREFFIRRTGHPFAAAKDWSGPSPTVGSEKLPKAHDQS